MLIGRDIADNMSIDELFKKEVQYYVKSGNEYFLLKFLTQLGIRLFTTEKVSKLEYEMRRIIKENSK
jgi:uncharacterized phage-like protein YoqJ